MINFAFDNKHIARWIVLESIISTRQCARPCIIRLYPAWHLLRPRPQSVC